MGTKGYFTGSCSEMCAEMISKSISCALHAMCVRVGKSGTLVNDVMNHDMDGTCVKYGVQGKGNMACVVLWTSLVYYYIDLLSRGK